MSDTHYPDGWAELGDRHDALIEEIEHFGRHAWAMLQDYPDDEDIVLLYQSNIALLSLVKCVMVKSLSFQIQKARQELKEQADRCPDSEF